MNSSQGVLVQYSDSDTDEDSAQEAVDNGDDAHCQGESGSTR